MCYRSDLVIGAGALLRPNVELRAAVASPLLMWGVQHPVSRNVHAVAREDRVIAPDERTCIRPRIFELFRDVSRTRCLADQMRTKTAVSGPVRGSVEGSSVQRFTLDDKSFGCGALGKIRTCDTRFRKPVLYPLSYEGLVSQNRWYVGIFRLSFKSTMSRDSGLGRTWAAPYRASIESARSSRSSS